VGFFGTIGRSIASAFWSFDAAPVAPNTEPNGGDGVQAYGGYLPSDERRPELTGPQKWITYANAYNTAVIATGLRYRAGLLGGAKWHAEPNPRGGAKAERGVDVVEQGLLHAQMPRPWNAVVRKASLYTFTGFSLHEWTIRRRPDDDLVVFAELAHRPQHTIDRWNKPSEQAPWDAVHQQTRAGNSYVIPRSRLFYCWDDLLTDSPEGIGLLRHVIELIRRLNVLEGLEGFGFETDLRGMPIGRAPIKALMAEAEAKFGSDKDKINAYVAEKTQNLRSALANLIKSPEKLQYLLLDSGTYQGIDQNTISAVQRWAFELLRGDSRGLPEINAAISRLQLEIARVLGIEFALMGAGASGSRAMHTDKTSLLGMSLQTTLTEIAAFATRDLARPLVALNGLDPDTCTPTLVAEPISTEAILMVCQALQALGAAGLAPDDPAWPVLRDRMGLPAPPDPTPEVMGMLGLGRRGSRPGRDATRGEVDLPSEDLGAKPAAAGKPRRR
jgi:hypothetical protein